MHGDLCHHPTRKRAWRLALLQFGGLTALAYIVTTAVFQVGKLFV
jgi:hypothetical protein